MRIGFATPLAALLLIAAGLARREPSPAASVPAGTMLQAADLPKFLGAPTCSGPACHGRNEPTDRNRSQQTEFTVWSTQDKHHQAFAVLSNDLSLRMAELLKMPKPPQQSDRCLNCHSMNVLDPARRGQDFRLSDGVSCDGCHGPAERWFGTHLNEPYDQSVEKGMKDIRNPIVRAEMCISCHVGNRAEGKIVDHEMLAAGHPALEFELDAYSRRMPPHWRTKSPAADGSDLPRAATWAAGQFVTLRDAARLVAAEPSERWPEYAHFDCSACHHDLDPDSWRQRRPRPGAIGRPIWQASTAAALVVAARPADSTADAITQLDQAFSMRAFGEHDAVAQRAANVAERLDEIIRSMTGDVTSAESARLLALKLCSSAETIAWRGPAAARQLAFALESLLDPMRAGNAPLARALDALQAQLDADRESYDPRRITMAVQEIAKLIK